MQLGWIDFSKDERSKVLTVIDLLSEDSTLDELGIASIRDGFANIFFPGTSTIQTRAKYFIIVPCILSGGDVSQEENPRAFLALLDEKERQCGKILTDSGADGIVGSRSLKSGNWVKRTPTDIYWSGLRRYGIFTGGNLSLSEYVKASCLQKGQRNVLKKLGNRKEGAEENECDDENSGGFFTTNFWSIPTFSVNWMDELKIDLSKQEAAFLKNRIISSCAGSMMAFILENNLSGIPERGSFDELVTGFINQFPEKIQADYFKSKSFSDFIYGARIRYNMILSKGENKLAASEWKIFMENVNEYSEIDIAGILRRLDINNPMLRDFLINIQKDFREKDEKALDEHIIKREIQLKGANRSKLNHAEDYSGEAWIGGRRLDYRFGNASVIINDIFKGMGAAKC